MDAFYLQAALLHDPKNEEEEVAWLCDLPATILNLNEPWQHCSTSSTEVPRVAVSTNNNKAHYQRVLDMFLLRLFKAQDTLLS